MPAPAWENPADFLSPDDFGTTAAFTTADGAVIRDVPGIFDDAVMNAQTGEYDMAAGIPRYTCVHASVVMLKRNDTAVIDGRAFTLMHDPRPDGTGWCVLEFAEDF
ncbi:head-tail joining protein [Stenotrophomonas maltophilia]|uniref:head-tail joining protein n=1 Tax=Stenotrophomonas maltophilia TaxID=40324 RepID=UPI002B1D7B21|nr:hypothetical protein [Stenotrophomonas maltophilia]